MPNQLNDKENIVLNKTTSFLLVVIFLLLFFNFFLVNKARAASVCGNSIVEQGETCDDGNTVSGDGCSSTCQTESSFQSTLNSSTAGAVQGAASAPTCSVTSVTLPCLEGKLEDLIVLAAGLMFGFAIFEYIGSGGESKKITSAKGYLTSAVTALIALALVKLFLH